MTKGVRATRDDILDSRELGVEAIEELKSWLFISKGSRGMGLDETNVRSFYFDLIKKFETEMQSNLEVLSEKENSAIFLLNCSLNNYLVI